MKRTILVAMFTATVLSSWAQSLNNPQATSEKFNTLLYFIENLYVDSVESEKLVETAIRSMLEELDPHSIYYSAKDMKAANEPLNGNFDGIGIQFNILKDTIVVVSPISGGPSEKLGILPGDKIITVEEETVAGIGITNRDVAKRLKGPKGTIVNVGVQRKGANELIPFEIERDKIPIYSVDASYMADPETGYIKVSRFARTTMEELHNALTELQAEGMENLILDLQGNGGGLLNTAIEMADEFLSGDKLMVYTEGRVFEREDTRARRTGKFEKGNLIVLIDEGSASASEIVSGAIQDWDRGLIVGRRSFGKGLVQRPVNLPDGSAVRLTVQKYYTPTGRCIQKSYEGGVEAYRMEKFERYESGELYSLDELELPDSLKFETLKKKRTVFGGGGILPDVFVPLDTTLSSEYFSKIVRKGITNSFMLQYLDDNRKPLMKAYPDSKSFVKNYEIDEKFMNEFLEAVAAEGIEFDQEGFDTSKKALELRLKALLGRNLFDFSVFFQVINELNPAYMKSLQILSDGSFQKMKLAYNDF